MHQDLYDVRSYELDARGELSLVFLVRMLQESAGRHATLLNFARDQLAPRGLTWVLGRFHVRLNTNVTQLPGWRSEIKVQTWRSGFERLFALRDYRALDASERWLAEATSHWAIIDVQKRLPILIPQFIVDSYQTDAPRALASAFEKIPAIKTIEAEARIEAKTSAIDVNNHVTNTAYITWLLENTPAEISREMRPRELEIIFRSEAFEGDLLLIRIETSARDGASAELIHQIIRPSDDREIVRARSRWWKPLSGNS